jgi:hypothetical protein
MKIEFYWLMILHSIQMYENSLMPKQVQFNDYWVENVHSRIRATTSPTDDADAIQKQAYVLGR